MRQPRVVRCGWKGRSRPCPSSGGAGPAQAPVRGAGGPRRCTAASNWSCSMRSPVGRPTTSGSARSSPPLPMSAPQPTGRACRYGQHARNLPNGQASSPADRCVHELQPDRPARPRCRRPRRVTVSAGRYLSRIADSARTFGVHRSGVEAQISQIWALQLSWPGK